ncbi:MAG: 50S ribosomal protein L32 [Candidatus Omnitrophica bacterium]|nr:50S ribosomal protein L32 [Candidatus Omnitrophota bacterium]
MAHPKRRQSSSRSAKRRTHQKLAAPALSKCSQCARLKPGHMVCPFCGYYDGREIIKIKMKEKKPKK